MVPDDALQLEEPLEGLFVDSELFVAQTQVVQSLEIFLPTIAQVIEIFINKNRGIAAPGCTDSVTEPGEIVCQVVFVLQ